MAASSLQEPLNEIKRKFELENKEFELEINYAGSQIFFSQIKMGAEA
jgi:molybdate transport system substrate-binding protein